MLGLENVIDLIKGDFLETKLQDKMSKHFDSLIDVILSDMAANTTGNKDLDCIRTNLLCSEVINFSRFVVKKGGTVIAKLFNGYDFLDVKKLEAVNKPIEIANGLPNECYTSEEYLTYEKDRVFCDKWTVIGVGSSVPSSGDAKPYNLLGIPLIMIRDKDMKIRVFHNVCSHRGHKLLQKPCRLKNFIRCPYHSWTYDLNGKLLNAPHLDIDKEDNEFHLKQIYLEDWGGFLFCILYKSPSPRD